jgi:hypothetical protein
MNTTPPTLHLSYCPTTKSISANFSKPHNYDLTHREEEAITLVGERFSEQSADLLNEPATNQTFSNLKSLCQSIIEQVAYETGVEINLDTTGTDQFISQSRHSYYGD